MAESIGARVGRIVAGSVNGLVDAIESAAPETVMEQAIREIDQAIDDVRAQLGKVIANRHLANTRLAEESRRHDELSEQAALALKEGREDLAEAAIERQLDIEAQIPVLETSVADANREEKEYEGYINALQAKKREMKEALLQFRSSREESAAAGSTAEGMKPSLDSKVDKAESAFDRVLESATGLQGRLGQSVDSSAKLAELEDLARNNRVKERMAQLKASSEDS